MQEKSGNQARRAGKKNESFQRNLILLQYHYKSVKSAPHHSLLRACLFKFFGHPPRFGILARILPDMSNLLPPTTEHFPRLAALVRNTFFPTRKTMHTNPTRHAGHISQQTTFAENKASHYKSRLAFLTSNVPSYHSYLTSLFCYRMQPAKRCRKHRRETDVISRCFPTQTIALSFRRCFFFVFADGIDSFSAARRSGSFSVKSRPSIAALFSFRRLMQSFDKVPQLCNSTCT